MDHPQLYIPGLIEVKTGEELSTANKLLVPLSIELVLTAVTVKFPPVINAREWLLSTPFKKFDVVPLPDDKFPVELISTVPEKLFG